MSILSKEGTKHARRRCQGAFFASIVVVSFASFAPPTYFDEMREHYHYYHSTFHKISFHCSLEIRVKKGKEISLL